MTPTDLNARLVTVAAIAPVAIPSMVVCPASCLMQVSAPQLAMMAAMYQVASEAAYRSVLHANHVRRWSEPSMN